MRHGLLKLMASAFFATTAATAAAEAPGSNHFITHRGGKLYEGDRPFRFVSWNIPNLHTVEDAFEFLGSSPWRWPDAFEIADALESVRQMRGAVARTYVISVRRDGGDMAEHVHVLGPGEFNEEAFRTLDLVLKIAREKGIRVIIPLVDNWHWWGGVREYEAFRGKPKGSFWSDPQLREDYQATVRHVLNRKNTLTGIRYRDDPTIFGWETGNELDAPPEWTRRTAAFIKELDPNHLVIDGRSLHGVPTESLDDPNIDVVTTHHYPNSGNNDAQNVIDAARLIGGRKAYFVGEFGFLPLDEAQRMIDAVIDEGVSGALYWSLRFHRREGGFYWHREPSGDNLFKAYHWPGFPEGDAYRENDVVTMIRTAAHRIRGLELRPPQAPAAPRMLPPTSPGLLSWQGSAGARGYDVQRSPSATGPWRAVAENVSDAALQYRPLYSDEAIEPRVGYFYRVVARNETGESAPSNVVGPVTSAAKLLVDELQDDSRLESVQGEVEWRSGDSRKTQEDIHRLALLPGAAVTYQLSEPIRGVRVWVFTRKNAPPLELLASASGDAFSPISVERQSPPPQTNDYGYLRPEFITAAEPPRDSRFLRLSLPTGQASEAVEISRVEIRYGGADEDH